MSEEPELASVSIILPVRNEVDSIAAALDSCLDQSYRGAIEIVVADAHSTDGTRELVARYADSHDIRLVDNHDLVTPAGLNRAIESSTGSVIVRCDAHSLLPPTYVADAVGILEDTGAANVGGVQHAVGTSPIQRGIAAAMTSPIGVGNARFHRGGPAGPVDTVYLGVFDRNAIEEVGGFNESLVRNQDYELNIRLRERERDVWFDPGLSVEYTPRPSFTALWRQYNDYGKWKRRVVGMHPGSLKARQAAPPLLVLGLATSAATMVTPLRPLGASVLGVYVTALGAAGTYEALRTKDPAALWASVAIGVMHVAWGSGFLFARQPEMQSP